MLIRQHSEKIGTLAEDVVLPRNERLIRRTSRIEDVPMQNIESQYPHPTAAIFQPTINQSKHFPVFMIGISFIQVIVSKRMEKYIFISHLLRCFCII